jgi:hypothetical protein
VSRVSKPLEMPFVMRVGRARKRKPRLLAGKQGLKIFRFVLLPAYLPVLSFELLPVITGEPDVRPPP